MGDIIKFRRPSRRRVLRLYQRIAFKDHGYCSECDMPIFSGDFYFGQVFVWGKQFWIEKRHQSCPIDPDHDQKERKGIKTISISAAA